MLSRRAIHCENIMCQFVMTCTTNCHCLLMVWSCDSNIFPSSYVQLFSLIKSQLTKSPGRHWTICIRI